MTRAEILREIETLTRVPPGSLTGAESLRNLAGWDSMAIMEFVMALDEKTGVDIPAEEVRQCARVEDLVAIASAATS